MSQLVLHLTKGANNRKLALDRSHQNVFHTWLTGIPCCEAFETTFSSSLVDWIKRVLRSSCQNCGGGDRWSRHLSSFEECSMPRPTTGVLLVPCHDEFRGPRSDYIRQVALATTTTKFFKVCLVAYWGMMQAW
ncbi:hypothetical protein TNCV_1157021 [Trichonephila clavipes]|nr:hypothetical protein TNCV_1157021 [Trichonephila clavipes]